MPFSDKRPQILVMENGLNLDTAIRTGNLAIVSDQYTVHCRPLANADKRPQILVMENGLNLDKAIRTLAVCRDTVHPQSNFN